MIIYRPSNHSTFYARLVIHSFKTNRIFNHLTSNIFWILNYIGYKFCTFKCIRMHCVCKNLIKVYGLWHLKLSIYHNYMILFAEAKIKQLYQLKSLWTKLMDTLYVFVKHNGIMRNLKVQDYKLEQHVSESYTGCSVYCLIILFLLNKF